MKSSIISSKLSKNPSRRTNSADTSRSDHMSLPISYPLKTLDDLENRSYFDSFHFPYNKSSVPLSSYAAGNQPKLLVCHDMKNGYQEDKWVQGSNRDDIYAIWHWHLIDIFVYFSHSLVTLPPPCWTNAAHKHGVQVILFVSHSFVLYVFEDLHATYASVHLVCERQ